ncbi:MAG: hypothetical protein KJO77_10540, partial [Bacteroidia bacterium]|nr:hypothetical protein [Bacteroidia bacterium]
MQTLTKFLIALVFLFSFSQLKAQDSIQGSTSYKIELLKKQKEKIKAEERDFLKAEVERINERLDRGEITNQEADNLKKEVAQKRASNIENRLAIVDNKIALLERNLDDRDSYDDDDPGFTIRFGRDDDDYDDDSYIFIGSKRHRPR